MSGRIRSALVDEDQTVPSALMIGFILGVRTEMGGGLGSPYLKYAFIRSLF